MSYKCVVGDSVSFKYDKYEGHGIVKFVGSLLPNKKGLWVGIERNISSKTRESKEFKAEASRPEGYNGKLGDMKYFECKKGRGIFIPYDYVEISIDDINDTATKQTELQQIIPSQEYPSAEDQKIPSIEPNDNNDDNNNNIQQQLDKAQQLLEASLLLLQSGILYGRSINKKQLEMHCEESWQFLGKKYPLSVSPMFDMNTNKKKGDIDGVDEEKFVSYNDKHIESDTIDQDIDNISIQQKKLILIDFMNRYSDINNWKKAGKELYDGVESYTLKLDKNRIIQVRMSFLYSMVLYLIHITGSNKRCIGHGTILLMPQKQQIETLGKEFKMILQTLQYNDDDGLWQYIYKYITDIFRNFSFIKNYSGKRIELKKDDNNDNENVSDDEEDSKMLNSMFKLKALITKK